MMEATFIKLAEVAKTYPDYGSWLGATPTARAQTKNLQLSDSRAKSVSAFLAAQGVAPIACDVARQGSAEPVAATRRGRSLEEPCIEICSCRQQVSATRTNERGARDRDVRSEPLSREPRRLGARERLLQIRERFVACSMPTDSRRTRRDAERLALVGRDARVRHESRDAR